MSAQVSEKDFLETPEKYNKNLNSILAHLAKLPVLPLRFPKLDKDTLSLKVYSDSSYANNPDGTSQLGYIIFLTDSSGKCQPLYWSSKKAKRVTRSVLASETMAFADAFDTAFILKHDLQRMINQSIPIIMITDSLSLFDVITKVSITAEKRLMIDLKIVRQSYASKEIEKVGFVRTLNNPADSLTKPKRCHILEKILTEATISHPIEQWVNRC
eukprot:IDg1031t1